MKKNGFIVKEFCDNEKNDKNDYYCGVGKYVTWPLDTYKDETSKNLVNEAEERWFNYQDNRLWAVPDIDYIRRYIHHCEKLGLSVFCLQIESDNEIITTDECVCSSYVMGYDYADIDMNTSCLYDDMFYEEFLIIKNKLNRYGLLSSIKDMYEYLNIRNVVISKHDNVETYFSPTIIRISKVEKI